MVGTEERLFRNKIIRFLVDQASSMEQTLEEMRALADNASGREAITRKWEG